MLKVKATKGMRVKKNNNNNNNKKKKQKKNTQNKNTRVSQCVLKLLKDILLSADDLLVPWETETGSELRFPVPCTQMAVCEVGNEVRYSEILTLSTLWANSADNKLMVFLFFFPRK